MTAVFSALAAQQKPTAGVANTENFRGGIHVKYDFLPPVNCLITLVPPDWPDNRVDPAMRGYSNGQSDGDLYFYPAEHGKYELRIFENNADGKMILRQNVWCIDGLFDFLEADYVSRERMTIPRPWYPNPIYIHDTLYTGFKWYMSEDPVPLSGEAGNFLTLDFPEAYITLCDGFIVVKGTSYLNFNNNLNHLNFTVRSRANGRDYYDNYVLFESGPFEILIFLNNGPGDYTVTIKANSLENFLTDSKELGEFIVKNYNKNTLTNQNYLQHTGMCQSRDVQLYSQAVLLTYQCKTEEEKARAIFDFLVSHLMYDFQFLNANEISFFPRYDDAVSVYNSQRGVCSGISRLTAAMMRAAGLPAKVIGGFRSGSSSGHAWNEVFWNGSWHNIDIIDQQFDFHDNRTKTEVHDY